MADDAGEVAARLWAAVEAQSWEEGSSFLHDDYVQEWPQSGERIRGRDNAMAINKNYPGIPKVELRGVRSDGNLAVAEVTLDYGGRPVHGVSIFEVKDGKISFARRTISPTPSSLLSGVPSGSIACSKGKRFARRPAA